VTEEAVTEHSILCPAFVGTLERLAGVGASGPCECGVEPPSPLPVHEDAAPESALGTEDNPIKAPPGETVYPRDTIDPTPVAPLPMFMKAQHSVAEGQAAPGVATPVVGHGITTPLGAPSPQPVEPKTTETACADSRPAAEPSVAVQTELPFDPEPLIEPEPEKRPEPPPANFERTKDFERTTSQGKPDPNGGYLAPVAAPLCVACGGSGQSSKGGPCSPCGGTGEKPIAATQPAASAASREAPRESPAPPAQDATAPAEKPKRKRRTKAEIEADKAVKAAAAGAASTGTTPTSPSPPVATAPTTPQAGPAWTFAELSRELKEAASSPEKVDVVLKRAEESWKAMSKALADKVAPTVAVVSTEETTKLQVAVANHEAVIKKLIQERDTYKEASETWKTCFERSEQDRKNGVAPSAGPPAGPRKRIFVGIDPGLTGFQSAVDENMKVVFTTACPTIEGNTRRIHDAQGIVDEVRRWKEFGIDTVLMEAQQAFPKIGSIANFVKGVSKGVWEAALLANGVRFDTLRPIDWKKAMGVAGGAPKDVKRRAIAKAQRLFPGIDLREKPDSLKARKLSSDKAESLLLAVYVARMALGAAPGTERWENLENADAAAVRGAPALDDDAEDAVVDAEKAAALKEFGERIKRGVKKGLKNLAKITKLPVPADPKPTKPKEKDLLRAAIKRAAAKGKKT
jgi:hypothetical protein